MVELFGRERIAFDWIAYRCEVLRYSPQRGKVTATGNGALTKSGDRSPLTVKKGDLVIFGKYSGTDVKVDGKEYKILRENEVLARLD